jgi:hypothetical protein
MRNISPSPRLLVASLTTFLTAGLGAAAHADIPVGYKGTPFDPAVAGGTFNGMPTTAITKAGPYPIPGRLEFENYDMGGLNIGYFTTDHIGCAGGAYRKDGQTASLCATSPMADLNYSAPNGDVYYDTGTALDGTTYPNATTEDVYIGAVRPGDYVNITVNVLTAGTYDVSSTWASGNGNPGKEGGNGAMELKIFTNGTMVLDWTATFPNYNTTANFHNWKTYDMGTVTLPAGLQVIKMQSVDPHLNLDYVLFSIPGTDGGTGTTGAAGVSGADASATGTGGAAGGSAGTTGTAGATSTTGGGGQSGALGTTGTAGQTGSTSGGAGTTGAAGTGVTTTGTAGASVTGAAGIGGTTSGTSGTTGTVSRAKSSSGCAYAPASRRSSLGGALTLGAAMALGAIARRRRRTRR